MNAFRPRTHVRLAFSSLFWRLLLGFSLLFEILFGLVVLKKVPPDKWLIAFVFWSPPFLGIAFMLASSLTLLANLAVRLIVRPRLLSWLSPKVESSNALFHLEPREEILVESPARMARGRTWIAGRLVQTDRRLLFLPRGWDIEPWAVRRDQDIEPRSVDAPNIFWGFVRDLPPHLEIRQEGEEPRRFALADARAWSLRSLGRTTPTTPLSLRSI